jgi:cyclopropane fatty-acyl-phospholipid synthase-like methyltransferase
MDQLAENYDQVDLRAFYDFIARPEIGYVVHSFKAESIQASGLRIAQHIAGRRSVLDLGCNIGYLTTWYASLSADRSVIGVDWSERSIHEARKLAQRIEVRNVEFQVCDLSCEFPPGHFEAIVEAQCLDHMQNRNQTLTRIASALADGGIFVSVAAPTSFDELVTYAHELPTAGLFVRSTSFIGHSDLGETCAYPVFVCDTTPPGADSDYEQFYAEMLSYVQTKRQHGDSLST